MEESSREWTLDLLRNKPNLFNIVKSGFHMSSKSKIGNLGELSPSQSLESSGNGTTLLKIPDDTKTLVTANERMDSSKIEPVYPLSNLLNNRVMTAKEVLPKKYFERTNTKFKTPREIHQRYLKWLKIKDDAETWHINKSAYNGKALFVTLSENHSAEEHGRARKEAR